MKEHETGPRQLISEAIAGGYANEAIRIKSGMLVAIRSQEKL
jgi:hypothetical protein